MADQRIQTAIDRSEATDTERREKHSATAQSQPMRAGRWRGLREGQRCGDLGLCLHSSRIQRSNQQRHDLQCEDRDEDSSF